jgi:hypothetical protein
MGKCECRPGFTAVPVPDDINNATVCQPPTVTLAKFLNMGDEFNKNTTKITANAGNTTATIAPDDSDDDSNDNSNDDSNDDNNSNNGVHTR